MANVQRGLRLSTELDRKLEAFCEATHRNPSVVVRAVLELFLQFGNQEAEVRLVGRLWGPPDWGMDAETSQLLRHFCSQAQWEPHEVVRAALRLLFADGWQAARESLDAFEKAEARERDNKIETDRKSYREMWDLVASVKIEHPARRAPGRDLADIEPGEHDP